MSGNSMRNQSARRPRARLAPRLGVALMAAALAAVAAAPARAGDYVSRCASASGDLVMAQDKLFNPRQGLQELTYEVLKKTVLLEEIGYCENAGEQYPFAAEHSVMTIRIQEDGLKRVAHLICETLAVSLPDEEKCGKEVVTSRSGLHSEP